MKNHIKNFWDNQGKKYKDSHWASWGDNYGLTLEIDNIGKYLNNNDHVLDVGCANGYSTFKQLEKNSTLKLLGIDYSESMIDGANLILNENIELKKSISFNIGDITKLKFKDNIFDKVYTTRVLINLPTWEEQIIGINELIRVTKKGGKILISEAFFEPLINLNAIRLIAELPPLVEHDFNRYIKISKLEQFLNENNLEFEKVNFSSLYYLGSRFIREFTTNINNYEGYSNPINEIFFNIENEFSGGKFGIQQLYVITKK